MDKKKLYIVLGGAAGVGALFYIIKSRSSGSGTASTLTGGSAVSNGSPQYFVPITSTGAVSGNPQSAPVTAPSSPSTTTTSTSNTPAPISTPTLAAPTPSGNTAAVVALNPYGVGTRVTSSETISQSVYDPLYNSWVDLTSKGGIYTSPGTSVSGSGYNPAWNGSGRLALANGGAQVAEYNSQNKLVGTYSIGK